MSTTAPFKFKKIRTHPPHLKPNGYRLATVEEVRNNFLLIKRRVLLGTEEEQGMRLLDEYKGMRLLDGRILPVHRIENTGASNCFWSLVVKEKERDKEARVWKKKCSACYPSNGNLLRKQLYDGINPSQNRDTVFALAYIHGDVEVIYWLLKTTNPTELTNFRNLSTSLEIKKYALFFGSDEMESLLASEFPSEFPLQFPLHLPLKEDNLGRTTLDRYIRYMDFYAPEKILFSGFIELLIEVYSTDIVQHKTRNGMSILDKATSEAINDKDWIPVLTKLLSVSVLSQHPVESHVSKIKHCFGEVFIEAVERGYAQLVEDLLKLKDYVKQLTPNVYVEVVSGAVRKRYPFLQNMLDLLKENVGNDLQQDKHGKTLFHYAAVESENEKVFKSLATAYQDEYKVKKRDKWGRTFLHWAALNGQKDFCKICVEEWFLKVDAKDKLGQNSLHLAAEGKKGHLVVDYLVRSSSVDLIYAKDGEGRTPLHFASARGNIKMVEKLLFFGADNDSQVKQYIEEADGFGTNALQMAAGGGHTRIVRMFLNKGCDNLLHRDVHGRTALHYATQAKDAEVALAISQSLLNKYENESEEKSLLLWASAAGIGTADERKDLHPLVKGFLLQEKAVDRTHLLQAAATTNNVEMAWELLNRGADIGDIFDPKDPKWENLSFKEVDKELKNIEKKNIKMVIKEIEIANEQALDKPSPKDNLGRNVLADGLAALFLNRFIESPITVGISGEWGMGKSSLMIQTENILLMAASQLSFPNLLPSENFRGAKKMSLSTKGGKIYRKMKNTMNKLLALSDTETENFRETAIDKLFEERYSTTGEKIYRRIKNTASKLLPFSKTENRLVKLLEEYRPQYHAIYKSLACMDVHNQMLRSDVKRESQFQPTREVPRILTIQYNAWHYRGEHEAWAGLAVTITKEIERAMTRAQRFSTCWRYSWVTNSVNICMQIFWPCLLATFLAGWVAWAAWTLLKEAKFKDLKYGSIPFTIITIVWGVSKSIISVVKPVSTQMMRYINSPDHTARLGYQEQVISDINFLKGELGKKPHWFFSFISGEWCWNWFGLHPDNVENTCIPKFSPASEDQLRMITFVDDLDRCDEKVILQVLSAINLVLAECKINVILGIDKRMIQRAVERHFENNDDRDLAEKFICKIIQIPLSLPDPTDEESDKFLQHYLGYQPPAENTIEMEDSEFRDYGDIDTDNDDEGVSEENPRQESATVEIDSSNGPQTSQSITKKVLHWFPCFFRILYLLACNLPSELRQMQDELNEKQIRPLTFSKGARLTREMLLLKYSQEEAETLYKLKKFVTGSQKHPREWKRFLDYRKFACDIVSMTGKVHMLPGWRVELMAWTFICWQWKHEMNTIIKSWHKYARVQSEDKNKSMEDEDEVKEHWYGPSLKQIVTHYLFDLRKSQQNSNFEGGLAKDGKLNSTTIEMQEGLMKLKQCLRQDPFIKAILSMYGHDTTVEESQTQYSNWLNLLKALRDVQDVSMRGIQLFQQFRLHCETDHLSWPLPKSNVDGYEGLMREIDAALNQG